MSAGTQVNTGHEPQRRRARYVAPAVFALLTIAMFGDVLLTNQRVLSHRSTDLALQFLPWRQFGFEQMRQRNLPLWNPHIYGGTPYFAGFQSALLYPPNWLHLILPLNLAINWVIALHVFAAGYFAYLWVRRRGVSVAGAILAGAMFMFGGPYFLHVYAGHLPHLAVMVWTPLALLAIDELARTGSAKWVLLGAGALAMQILAGHPQYVYYTGIALTAYALLSLATARHRVALAGGFVGMYVGAAMLSAVQLLPGVMTTKESVRGAGTTYAFASTFSLPPRNFITMIAPNFFGRLPMSEGTPPPDAYWGAGYLWEMSLFVSLTGLLLATYGVVARRAPPTWVALAMIALTLLLALGRHTPLYRLMYEHVPQYASFRGTVKFAYLTSLFVALLAAYGFDALAHGGRGPRVLIATIAVASAVALVAATLISGSETDGEWARSLRGFANEYGTAGEIFVKSKPDDYSDPAFVRASARAAARSLFIAAGVGAAIVAALFAHRRHPAAKHALVALAVVELFVFARMTRATMEPSVGIPDDVPGRDAWQAALRGLPRGHRILLVHPNLANLGMSMGFDGVWGYDPLALRRYAELLFKSQGYPPDEAAQYLAFRRIAPGVFRALRCARVLVPDARQPVVEISDTVPVVAVVGKWVELPTRDAALNYIVRDEFDPRRGVVVGSDPGVASGEARVEGSTVEIVGSGTDYLDVKVSLPRDALLLITNNYARGWRARALGPNPPQTAYEVVPANYAQQAVPLRAGSHHVRIEYAPVAFRIGATVSVLAIVAFAATGALWSRRASATPERGSEAP